MIQIKLLLKFYKIHCNYQLIHPDWKNITRNVLIAGNYERERKSERDKKMVVVGVPTTIVILLTHIISTAYF